MAITRNDERWFEYYCSASQAEKDLFEKVSEFGKYFEDMLLLDNLNNEVDSLVLPEELEYFDYTWFMYKVEDMDEGVYGCYSHKDQVLKISSTIEDYIYEPAILHEMIHLHEDVINEYPLYYHDILYWKLYSSLRDRIEKLDEYIRDCLSLYESREMYNENGLHDILFLLKSFDLDLRMGYEIGTVFMYGKREEIRELNLQG